MDAVKDLDVSSLSEGLPAMTPAFGTVLKEKLAQTTRSAGKLPAYVVVIQFGTPLAEVVKI